MTNRYRRRSAPLIIRERPGKAIMRLYITPVGGPPY
jgi:hypothetical protein